MHHFLCGQHFWLVVLRGGACTWWQASKLKRAIQTGSGPAARGIKSRYIYRHSYPPVVDRKGHVLGIVTVDDIIDAMIEEHTEDVQKFGGVEALDAPYMEIGFLEMIR